MLTTWTGLLDHAILQTPIAVLDFETTGMRTGWDRVVEVSVVRLDPGQPMNLVLDSLIQPDRRVTATEIHGITDRDVADAPRFADIAGNLLEAISGCILAAYNVAFEVADFDDLMAGRDHLLMNGHGGQPYWGVGRHVLGGQIFDYWKDPLGFTVEHWTDSDLLDAGTAPGSHHILAAGNQWGPPPPADLDF